MAPSHPAAQLVQLCQAKFIGAAHQNRVGRGHINAGLDDGGAQQNIEALRHKVAHDFFQFALGHLSMRHCNTRFRYQLLQALFAVLNGLHLVVQEIALPAALKFS